MHIEGIGGRGLEEENWRKRIGKKDIEKSDRRKK
jgi:hypothetical protein